jgi:hypothetical protein
MKATIRGIILTATGLLFASVIHTHAIEGLKLSVQCSNVVLSWPSASDETYIVQYRLTLDTSTPWQTLTSSLPAAAGTNLTFYVHSNIVQYPNCGGGDSFAAMSGGGTGDTSKESSDSKPSAPLAMRADDVSSAVPLVLYPPGYDLSGFLIYDPTTDEWIKGSAQSRDALSADDLPQPEEGDDQEDEGAPPETEFYRVVRNGVHFWGLTNGIVLSGVVDVPLEMSLSSTDQITGVSFYGNDGAPLVGAREKNDGSPWIMEWDTAMVPNGTYVISAEVDFAGDDSATNIPVTVTVSNLISFPNYFTRIFGDWMWVHAEMAIPEADYEVAMYADETNYIGSFYGYTDDGVISFLWDLTDGGSYTFTNETFKGEFYVTPTGNRASGSGSSPTDDPTSSQPGTNFWAKEYRWSGVGKFAVAYSPLDNNGTTTYRIGLMVSGGTGGEYGGVTQTLGNYGLGIYELSPGNGQGDAFQMSNGATKTNLLTYLWDLSYRNFYYFGHGSPSAVGGAPGTTVPTITSYELQHTLFNFLSSPKPANYHPYRFVFMDGCRTGAGKMCEKFGIPAQAVSTNFFNTAGVRSRAFLGFKKTVSYNDSQWTWRSLMLGGFFGDWQDSTKTLQVCVSNAVNGVHSGGFQKMDSSWVVYGATNLNIFSP